MNVDMTLLYRQTCDLTFKAAQRFVMFDMVNTKHNPFGPKLAYRLSFYIYLRV